MKSEGDVIGFLARGRLAKRQRGMRALAALTLFTWLVTPFGGGFSSTPAALAAPVTQPVDLPARQANPPNASGWTPFSPPESGFWALLPPGAQAEEVPPDPEEPTIFYRAVDRQHSSTVIYLMGCLTDIVKTFTM